VDWVMYAGTYNLILQKHNIHLLDYTISASNFGKAIAILCAFIWGFALNKYVVFTDSPVKGRHQLFRYALIVSTCIGLNFLIINFLIRQFPLFDTFKTLANILTSFVVAIYSYIVQRSFTFKVHKK
jgi:putative flippase GtrA